MPLSLRLVAATAVRTQSACICRYGIFRHISTSGRPSLLRDIEPNRLEVNRIKTPKPVPSASSIKWGRDFTDHMLTIRWSSLSGWDAPRIEPCGSIPFHPSTMGIHYAQTLFEGFKAYRDEKGKITMFRPDMNMKRMNSSAARLALPTVNGDALIELIKELVRLDKHWVPREPGYSLYIRPTLMASEETLAIGVSNEALLFVICCPVGPYYHNGFQPVALYATTEYTRAAPGGTGSYKVGGNYGPAVVAQNMAYEKGYDQNLWLYGPEHYLTEVGTMNMFVVFGREDGATELVTPPLDGLILPGVTRDSILALGRDHAKGAEKIPGLPEKLIVSERPVTMREVIEASQSGRPWELFGAGTAAIISPVDRVGYFGKDIMVPTGSDGMGPVAKAMWEAIVGRQMGTIPSAWSVTVAE